MFAAGLWTRRRGLVTATQAEMAERFDCNRQRCFSLVGPGPRISAWWTRRLPDDEDMQSLCAADVIILRAAVAPPSGCASKLVLGLDDFHRGGAAELYPDGRGWRVAWAQPLRGVRPWTTGDVDE